MAGRGALLSDADAADLSGASALARVWLSIRAQVGHHLLVVMALSLGIAGLLTAMDGQGFWRKLVYSASIGTMCTLVVSVGRLGVAAGVDALFRRGRLPSGLQTEGWLGATLGALLGLMLGPAMGLALADALTGRQSASLLSLQSGDTRMTLALSVLGTVIAVTTITTLARLSRAREQAEAAQRLAAENQLRLLQSQLEPHMLFNTLANLRVLIGLEPARAQLMLDHLIAFLRATLSASRSDRHSLAVEFARTADYLALMQIRMGPRLQFELDLPADLREVPVPPLLLQPLVENAIRHGLEPQLAGGWVRVAARRQGQALVLEVGDNGAGLKPPLAQQAAGPATAADPLGKHFGLDQIRQRLATLYGAQGQLTLLDKGDDAGGVLATIRLPMPVRVSASSPSQADKT